MKYLTLKNIAFMCLLLIGSSASNATCGSFCSEYEHIDSSYFFNHYNFLSNVGLGEIQSLKKVVTNKKESYKNTSTGLQRLLYISCGYKIADIIYRKIIFNYEEGKKFINLDNELVDPKPLLERIKKELSDFTIEEGDKLMSQIIEHNDY